MAAVTPGTPLTMPGRAASHLGRKTGGPFVRHRRRSPAVRRDAAGRCPSRCPPARGRAGTSRAVPPGSPGRDASRAPRSRFAHRRERRSEGHGYSVPSQYVCGAHVCVHWVITTSDAPPLTDRTTTRCPTRWTGRSARSRPHGGSRSPAWGSAHRCRTGARQTTVPTTARCVPGGRGRVRVEPATSPPTIRTRTTTPIGTATTPRTSSSTMTSPPRSSGRAAGSAAYGPRLRTSSSMPCSTRTTRARIRG